MSEVKKIKQGLDIKLMGEAEKIIDNLQSSSHALKPVEFLGVFPKLLVAEGDTVKAGSPLFYDKYKERVKFTSPVSGKVTEIKRGKKRVLQCIKIEKDEQQSYVEFRKGNPGDFSREDILEQMLNSGIFAAMRQLPYAIVANPEDMPRDIFISGFDTSPLAPDLDQIVHGQGEYFQAGLDALKKLTTGKVHLGLHPAKNLSKVFLNSKGVEINKFEGPHPAGNVGIQIHHTYPVNKDEIVWYMNPADVIITGRLFLEGKYDATCMLALTGPEVEHPRYYRTIKGACVKGMLNDNLLSTNVRVISGNVLTGSCVLKDGYVGFYHNQISVIREGNQFEFLGWALPGFNKLSTSRSYLSWLTPNKKYNLNTNLNGGVRAFVMTGEYEKVLPMDILPVQLIKAVMVEDIDLMENLGIYEVNEEDFALCEFVCTSKINVQEILRKGLDFLRKELS